MDKERNKERKERLDKEADAPRGEDALFEPTELSERYADWYGMNYLREKLGYSDEKAVEGRSYTVKDLHEMDDEFKNGNIRWDLANKPVKY